MTQLIFNNVKIFKQVVLDTGNIEDWHSYFVESNPDQRFQISNIYIHPDFRRKAYIPNLAIIKFTGDALTKNSWTFDFDNPLWSIPQRTYINDGGSASLSTPEFSSTGEFSSTLL